jgi:hypothetical protein
MNRYGVAASITALSLITGCSTTLVTPYPTSWAQPQATTSCEAINGSYELFGVFGEGSFKNQPRFDYWILGDSRPRPMPSRVVLTYSSVTNKLDAVLTSTTGALIESISVIANCDHGQVTISRSFNIRGEGTSGTGVSTIRLMRAIDGSLVSAIQVKTEQHDFLIFPHSRHEGTWAQFRQAIHDAQR